MKNKKSEIFVIALIVLSVALVVLLVTVSDIKDTEILELKEQIEEMNLEYNRLEDKYSSLIVDGVRISDTDLSICCIIKDNNYYHRPYFCFLEAEELVDAFLIEQAKELGYTQCPICYGED